MGMAFAYLSQKGMGFKNIWKSTVLIQPLILDRTLKPENKWMEFL
jgi:hypothetical protein